MKKEPARVIHYMNQFFAGVGGEEMADIGVSFRDGPVGPGRPLETMLAGRAHVVGTVICGDNTASRGDPETLQDIITEIESHQGEILVAGPAFNAGRYGIACGAVCETVQQRLGLRTFTAMYPENPAVEQYRRSLVIVPTTSSAVGMRDALARLAVLISKTFDGTPLGPAREEGYIPHGIRRIELAQRTAAERALALLLRKIAGSGYETEVPLATYEQIVPAPPLTKLSEAIVGLVTEGGLVPIGNPDGIRHVWAKNWAAYDITGCSEFAEGQFEGVHGGFDRTWVEADPDRLLPLDIIRELAAAGIVSGVHDEFFSTVGNGTPVSTCSQFGREIAQRLLKDKVNVAILSAT